MAKIIVPVIAAFGHNGKPDLFKKLVLYRGVEISPMCSCL